MSLRRFVYLVTDDAKSRDYLLRRIDMSRFFFPKGKGKRDPQPPVQGRLPPAGVRFEPPANDMCDERMEFLLFGGGDNGRNKVLATTSTGRSMFYDPDLRSICTLPNFTAPKLFPISLTVGNNIFALDRDSLFRNSRNHCFERISYDVDWCCHPLPPPPYTDSYTSSYYNAMFHVDSYSVVGGSNIWISKKTLGTYSFDMASHLWTKVGDWALPFRGHVQYVREHNLWFGLSPGDMDEDEGMVCASDLTVTPPMVRCVWNQVADSSWIQKSSYLVHLGQSRFCHARFCKVRSEGLAYVNSVVLTGFELESCNETGAELSVVEHRSVQYTLANKLSQWIL